MISYDRNILISFENDKIIVENDWLGSIPIFYNQKENIISTLSNFCLKDKYNAPLAYQANSRSITKKWVCKR